MPTSNGPYLSYAVICEKQLHESDGVLSLIRLIDRATVRVTVLEGMEAPHEIPSQPINVTLAVGIKSGDYRGPAAIKIRVEAPSGTAWPEFETTAELEGGEHGHGLALTLTFPARDEGIYWFIVEVAGEEATRVPLNVVKEVVEQTIPPQLPQQQ